MNERTPPGWAYNVFTAFLRRVGGLPGMSGFIIGLGAGCFAGTVLIASGMLFRKPK